MGWGGSWHTSNHARMLKFGTQAGNPMSRTIVRSRMTPALHVSWHTSNHAKMLKFGIQVRYPVSRTVMRSGMTHIFHVSSQEHSMSSKSLMMTGGSWHTYNHARKLKFGTHVRNHLRRMFKMSRMTRVLHVSNQEPFKVPQVTDDDKGFLTHF